MLPNNNSCITSNCLESLVGVKANCTPATKCPQMYIEQIQGIDIKKLSLVANQQQVSGKMLAVDLIKNASDLMAADIDLLISNGYRMQESFGEQSSLCSFGTAYQNGGGIVVKNTSTSPYSRLNISGLEILAQYTGVAEIAFNDGKSIVLKDVELSSGVIAPVELDYSTNQKSVQIYFTDTAIQGAIINCPTKSGCGCGGNNPLTAKMLNYSGYLSGMPYATQYSFKPTAFVTCDKSMLLCELVKQSPMIYAATLLYKIGELYFLNVELSNRVNIETSTGEENKKDMAVYFNKLYNSRLNGTSQTLGLNTVISNYLKGKQRDKCIICDGIYKVAWATT